MDEEHSKVIDGTARTRQWRRSRSKQTVDADGAPRSEAPKSIASSLLVPADLLGHALPAPPDRSVQAGERTEGVAVAEQRDATTGDQELAATDAGNVFLSSDAAVVAPRRQRSTLCRAAGIRLLHASAAPLRAARGIRPWWPRFELRRHRAAGSMLALLGLMAGVAGLVIGAESSSSTSRSGGRSGSVIELDLPEAAVTSAVERLLAAAPATSPSRPVAERRARKRPAHRPPKTHRQASAHAVLASARSTPATSSYTPPAPASTYTPPTRSSTVPSASSGSSSSGASASSGSSATAETPAHQSASSSGGSTGALGSAGALAPGSSPNG